MHGQAFTFTFIEIKFWFTGGFFLDRGGANQETRGGYNKIFFVKIVFFLDAIF